MKMLVIIYSFMVVVYFTSLSGIVIDYTRYQKKMQFKTNQCTLTTIANILIFVFFGFAPLVNFMFSIAFIFFKDDVWNLLDKINH